MCSPPEAPTPTHPSPRCSFRLPALVALVATQIGLLSTSLSLPMLAPLLLGTGMLMRSIRTNASLVFPRIGLLVVLLWLLWFANSVIQVGAMLAAWAGWLMQAAWISLAAARSTLAGAALQRGQHAWAGRGPSPHPACAAPPAPPLFIACPLSPTLQNTVAYLRKQGAIDQRLANNINSGAELTVLVTAGVILLSMLGVNVSALLLPAGVAAAVAAKDLSHNFLAGFFLIMVQPFR